MIILKKGIQFGEFTLQNFKGEGTTAQVWGASDKNGDLHALKVFAPRTTLDNYSKQLMKNEFEKTKHLRNEYLVIPQNYIEFKNVPALVLPLCDYSLWQLLVQKLSNRQQNEDYESNILFTELELTKLLNHIGHALEFLHSNTYQHNDVKPGNILVTDFNNFNKSKYYLTDFGISKEMRDTILRQTKGSASLTYAYAAPEKLQGKRGNFRSDIFSLGASIYELINGASLEMPLGEILNNNGIIPPISDDYSPEFISLVVGMLDKEPEKRYSATDIVNYTEEFLNTGKWSNELKKYELNRDIALVHDNISETKRIDGGKADQLPNPTVRFNQVKPKKKSKKGLIAFLILLIIGAIGFGIYQYDSSLFTNLFNDKEVSGTSSDNNPTLQFLDKYDKYRKLNDNLFLVQKNNNCGIVNILDEVQKEINFRICIVNKNNRVIELRKDKTTETYKY